jgi:hypothetical protein
LIEINKDLYLAVKLTQPYMVRHKKWKVSMVGQHIKYTTEEEHILRKIGGAIIVLWETLDPNLQEIIVQQAADMSDRDVIVQGDFQIREFIKAHKGGD